MVTSKLEKTITVKDLFDYLEEHNLPYDVLNNIDAKYLAEDIGEEYKFSHGFHGEFNGDDITCFITVGGSDGMVFKVYGTIDDGVYINDCQPSYDLNDRCVRVK